jgi:hypothetical protein
MSKKKEYKSLLTILTISNPSACKEILAKYSNDSSVRDMKELQMKLARTYAVSSNKIDMERDFAQIHPHKDFIMKYFLPKEEFVVKDSPVMIETPAEPTKSANGCNCECSKYSNAEGNSPAPQGESISSNSIMMLSIVGIVAIVGMVSYMKR